MIEITELGLKNVYLRVSSCFPMYWKAAAGPFLAIKTKETRQVEVEEQKQLLCVDFLLSAV